MVNLSNSITYENYLYLRRQLGEQENGDWPSSSWNIMSASGTQNVINTMLAKCENLMRERDLSWEAYKKVWSKGSVPAYLNPTAWEEAPLFIKAAIIKPREVGIVDVREDVPQSEVTPW
jgi:hypothetical protein